jgi:hypothetical protein
VMVIEFRDPSVIFNSPICQTSYTSESFIMASNLGPGAEFKDEERQHLIEKLNSLLAGPGENYTLPPSMWAALWLCDLGSLKDLVKGLESNPSFRGVFNNPVTIGESVLNRCMLLPTTIRFGA